MTDSEMVKIELDQMRVHMAGECERMQREHVERDNATRIACDERCAKLEATIKELQSQLRPIAEWFAPRLAVAAAAAAENAAATRVEDGAVEPVSPVEIVEVKASPEPAEPPPWPTGPTFERPQ